MRYLKYLLGISFWMTCIITVAQQRPVINSLSKTSGTVGETITITGSGFPTNTADVQVNFGAGVATVTSTADNQLQVVVPNTATVAPVTVLDKTTGLLGVSKQKFILSFSGGGFDATTLDDPLQENFATAHTQIYDVCLCDFDLDGDLDVAVSFSISQRITVFINSSTPTTQNYSQTDIITSETSLNIACGDLNGNGIPDIIASNEQADRSDVSVYQNDGSGTGFTKDQSLKLPQVNASTNRSARRVLIADIDNDGKSDLVVGSNVDPSVFVYLNTSTTGGAITVSSPNQINITGTSAAAGSLASGDIDNDGLTDLVVLPFRENNSDMFFLKNISQQGAIRFKESTGVGVSNRGNEVILRDLNNDGFLEIIATDGLTNSLNIIPNNTSGGVVTFGDQISISAPNAWGIASADFDGDGLLDLATGNSASGGVDVFINNSSEDIAINGAINLPTTSTVRNLAAADMNGDGKPDFALTHRVGSQQENGEFTTIINRNCLTPTITPADLTFCRNEAFTLYATKTIAATYNWSLVSGTGSITGNGDNASVTITAGTEATIEVTIVADDGSCIGAGENTVQRVISISGGAPPAQPSVTSDTPNPVCANTSFTLSGSAGLSTYIWTLPGGRDTLITSTNQLTITNTSSEHAGDYILREQGTDCFSLPDTFNVVIDEPPLALIGNTGTDDFCATATTTLQVPQYDGFTYQWQENGTDIPDSTANTFTADNSGNYSVELTSVDGCTSTSTPYAVTAVTIPTSAFDAINEICVEAELDFSATSTGQAGFDLAYSWDFGDGSPVATTADVTHTFTTAGSYDVVLTTGYSNVDACTDTETLTVTVSDAPSATDLEALITPGTDAREKCPNDTIVLRLPDNYQSYAWTVNSDTISDQDTVIAATPAGVSSVTLTANVVTDIGCEVNDIAAEVANYDDSQIIISSSDAQIVNDTITLGENVSSVTLTAENGSDYTWSPASILNNATTAMVTAIPRATFTPVTVTGTDQTNGCVTTATIVIRTPGVIPRKSFSPNGDGLGFDCWEILNTNQLEGCTVYVMDERGRYVFKGNSPFADNCAWNGNIDNGSAPAPEGIYYFILKCENSDYNQTGSILLAR